MPIILQVKQAIAVAASTRCVCAPAADYPGMGCGAGSKGPAKKPGPSPPSALLHRSPAPGLFRPSPSRAKQHRSLMWQSFVRNWLVGKLHERLGEQARRSGADPSPATC